MKNIVFVGDSFCAHWGRLGDSESPHRGPGQGPGNGNPHQIVNVGHPGLVAAYWGDRLRCFGYGGKSWWYSWCRFQRTLRQEPDLLSQARAVIFFHTDCNRINCQSEPLTIMHSPTNFAQSDHTDSVADRALASAYAQYVRHDLYDEDFQQWAQQQYFRTLARDLGHLQTVHFNCFKESVTDSVELLPGAVFTTPLYEVSHRQPDTADRELANHLNAHNNQALAQVIIQAVEQYWSGARIIDLANFEQRIR